MRVSHFIFADFSASGIQSYGLPPISLFKKLLFECCLHKAESEGASRVEGLRKREKDQRFDQCARWHRGRVRGDSADEFCSVGVSREQAT
jgi:hypothetical protein